MSGGEEDGIGAEPLGAAFFRMERLMRGKGRTRLYLRF